MAVYEIQYDAAFAEWWEYKPKELKLSGIDLVHSSNLQWVNHRYLTGQALEFGFKNYNIKTPADDSNEKELENIIRKYESMNYYPVFWSDPLSLILCPFEDKMVRGVIVNKASHTHIWVQLIDYPDLVRVRKDECLIPSKRIRQYPILQYSTVIMKSDAEMLVVVDGSAGRTPFHGTSYFKSGETNKGIHYDVTFY